MAIYGLSDLHLAIDTPDKSMEVFGGNWKDYIRRIGENVRAKVTDGDTILMPGDLSWVMYLNDGKKDFSSSTRFPGRSSSAGETTTISGAPPRRWRTTSRPRVLIPSRS